MYPRQHRSSSLAGFWLLFFLVCTQHAMAQSPTISYPAVAQDVTRAYSQSNLTVKIVFNGVCTGATTVKVALPVSVNYVAGTVVKTAGTAGLGITEGSIADLSNPVFNISGIAAIGDNITFTVARSAACGNLATAKDSIYVLSSSGCSNGSELVGSVNTYNILSPSLAITPPAALTNAVVGTTATRTATITNGGNGVLDTLRYYIVYPGGGVINTSGTNAITANGTSFTPSSTSGDTLFYKIYGATLFGGNNLLSNGETVTITEPVKVVKCNTATAYGAGWGKTNATQCQVATGTSAVTMRTGVTDGSVVVTRPTSLLPCTPGTVKITYSGTGTGDTAGAIYHINPGFGRSDGGGVNFYITGSNITYVNFSNFLLNGTIPITPTYVNGRYVLALNFTTDPDGAGVGLDDLDGDGFYNDLLPGKSFYILATQTLTFPPECDNAGAGVSTIVMGDMYYKSMCSTGTDSTRKTYTLTGPNIPTPNQSIVKPGVVYGGQPFTVRTCVEMSGIQNFADYSASADSMVYEIQLPAGMGYVAGSAKYSNAAGTTTPTVTISGSTVQIRKNAREGFCLDYDLVYTCGTPGELKIPYKFYFVHDRSCGAIQTYKCDTIKISAGCPSPCTLTTAVNNIAPSKVVRTHYGWTDNTMTTAVDTATLSAVSKKTATLYDTVNVKQSGVQVGTSGNLYYSVLIDRVGAANIFTMTGGTINYKAFGTATIVSCALPAPTGTPVGIQTKYVWNLTGLSCLPTTFNNGDSMWVDMNMFVANAPSSDALTQPSSNGYFYNLESGAESNCGSWPLDVYVIGSQLIGISNNGPVPSDFSGCTSGTPSIRTYRNVSNNTFDNFPNEFRPSIRKDSIIVTLPAGYSWTGGICNLSYESFTSLQIAIVTNINVTPVVVGQQLIFKNPGTWPMSDVALTGNRGYDVLYIPMVANCEATTGTQPLNIRETGTQFLYTGSGQPYTSVNNTGVGNLSLRFANKPTLTVQNNTGVVQGILPQHYWDVTVSNGSLVAAPYAWLALEKPATSGIIIDSVKRRTGSTPTTVVPATGTYGATGNKWYQLSTAGIPSGKDSSYRVYFHYTSCTTDSIQLKAGWNCTGYPSADPSAYACSAAQTWLKVDPQPSQVQLSVTRQPGGGSSIDLCSTDSTLLIVNSAQAANLVNPYVTFYPPAGVTLASTIQVEYPLGSGNYQAATVTSIGSGTYKIDLSAHTAIGANGMLGTAAANPAFTPLGGDRQAKIKLDFSTSCGFSSGSSFAFSAFGNQPCGSPATSNGVTATTASLNINGVTVSGSAGVSIGFGSATSTTCGTPIPVSLTTTPTSVGTATGDTMVYTLPVGLAYAGGLTAGFAADTSGTGGATVIKIAMPVGVAANTPISYGFNVVPDGGGCGSSLITGAYKRAIAPLNCGGTPCTGSSVIIASAASPTITLNKPNLTLTSLAIDNAHWVAGQYQNVYIKYNNNSSYQAYTGNTDSVEFFCGSNPVPFAVRPLTKSLAIGANDSDKYWIYIPKTACTTGDLVTARIQTQTAAGTPQCLCNASSILLAGVPLPLSFISTAITADNCAANIQWTYQHAGTAADHFVIARSIDGTQFQQVATVAPDATGYIDVTPYSGNWHYRIGAVAANGTVTYSRTLSISTTHCSTNTFRVYPNPANGKVQIVLQGNSTNNSFELLDALGRPLLKGSLQENSNNMVDISMIAPGIYTFKLASDVGIQTSRLHIK